MNLQYHRKKGSEPRRIILRTLHSALSSDGVIRRDKTASAQKLMFRLLASLAKAVYYARFRNLSLSRSIVRIITPIVWGMILGDDDVGLRLFVIRILLLIQ